MYPMMVLQKENKMMPVPVPGRKPPKHAGKTPQKNSDNM